MTKKLILTVCKGNIHRSVIAAICLNRELETKGYSDSFICLSRGLQGTMGTKGPTRDNLYDYPMEFGNSEPALKELGICISKEQKKTPIDKKIVKKARIIIAMDNLVLKESPNSLHTQFPADINKMILYSELIDQTGNIEDIGGVDDLSKHSKAIFEIDKIARLGIAKLIRLVA